MLNRLRKAIQQELLSMAESDAELRQQLADDGSLWGGYHPRMAELHHKNSERLSGIVDTIGWPGIAQVGEEAAHAAWVILQHAIGDPDFQRRGLRVLQEAAARGDAAPLEVAMLEDRICTFEGKPQLYGTQYDWDQDGNLSPLPYDDAAAVDERRRALGLPSMEEQTALHREQAAQAGETAPADRAAYVERRERWLIEVGWRNSDSAEVSWATGR